jgi:hypothetical protein
MVRVGIQLRSAVSAAAPSGIEKCLELFSIPNQAVEGRADPGLALNSLLVSGNEGR